jgi:uncharacterized phage protein (TIGR02220 family)
MAGDWIKVEHATLDKAEVLRVAELLGVSRRECIGLLMDFWAWLDNNTTSEVVPNLSRLSMDTRMSCPGFAAALEVVGWVKWDDKNTRAIIVNYDNHNGASAKTRASEQRKKKVQRNSVPVLSRQEGDTSGTRVREELEKSSKSKAMSGSQASTDVVSLPARQENRERLQDAREVLGFLNAKTGRDFRPVDANLAPIMARMKEGATMREFRAVVARKCREWSGDEKMAQYLRPATLFNATKFAQYVGEVPPEVSDGSALS